jgi:hypothetical protein
MNERYIWDAMDYVDEAKYYMNRENILNSFDVPVYIMQSLTEYGESLKIFVERKEQIGDGQSVFVVLTEPMDKNEVIALSELILFPEGLNYDLLNDGGIDYIEVYHDNSVTGKKPSVMPSSAEALEVLKNTALNTDIRTYINGVEIPCFSVDGRCVVTAEDLRGYGFDVVWNGESKSLDITRGKSAEFVPVYGKEKGESGSFYADIYPTDITVSFNGKALKAYAINGEMLIQPESLESSGISFVYDDNARALYITVE